LTCGRASGVVRMFAASAANRLRHLAPDLILVPFEADTGEVAFGPGAGGADDLVPFQKDMQVRHPRSGTAA
jgi:hypothetical protein